jgi:hypothetical protein
VLAAELGWSTGKVGEIVGVSGTTMDRAQGWNV